MPARGSLSPSRSACHRGSPRCRRRKRSERSAGASASARAPTIRRHLNRKRGWGSSGPRRLCGVEQPQPQVALAFRFATKPAMTREMLFALALGYLLGSIPFGLVLTRLAGKGDVREIGSGNIGATNVLRTGSKPLAALTLVLDCLKATAAVLIARYLFGDEIAVFAATGALIGA